MSHDVCVITCVSHTFPVTSPLAFPSVSLALLRFCILLQCAAVCCSVLHGSTLCCTVLHILCVSLSVSGPYHALHCVARWYIMFHCLHILCVCLRVSGPYLVLRCVALRCAVVRCNEALYYALSLLHIPL